MWTLHATPFNSFWKFATDRVPMAIHLTLVTAGPDKDDWIARITGQDEPLYFDAEHGVEAVKRACLDLLIDSIQAEMKAVRTFRNKANREARKVSRTRSK